MLTLIAVSGLIEDNNNVDEDDIDDYGDSDDNKDNIACWGTICLKFFLSWSMMMMRKTMIVIIMLVITVMITSKFIWKVIVLEFHELFYH